MADQQLVVRDAQSSSSSSTSTAVDNSKLQFSEDEETLIIRMFNLVGERWGLIAGRIPGRSAEEIEKYWTSQQQQQQQQHK
ncbi:hypothetical protein QQ045_016365 [Rhodiola kirilowii]